MMANSFHAFINLENYMGWIELFGLEEAEPIYQKRVLSIVSGAILPLVALGFIKSLVDYIRPEESESIPQPTAYVVDATDLEEDIPEEAKKWKGAFDIETPVAGSAEPRRIHPDDPYPIDDIIPAVSEELPEEDLYSRDADKAKIPVEIGEVHIAPETVKTDNAVADAVAKPIPTEHITPVGDPIVIPTPETTAVGKQVKEPLTSRPVLRRTSVNSKP